jgi:hypothetical protein
MRVGCSCGSEALLVPVSLFGNAGLLSKGFMLAINTAGTYLEIQLLCTGSMTTGEICYKVYWLATIDPCIADFPENLLSPLKRLSLDIYHKGDTTLVTLGSVLACFSV